MRINKRKLKIAMANVCMNTADLQKVADIPRPTLDGAMQGKGVSPKTMGKIARALGIQPSEILVDEKE